MIYLINTVIFIKEQSKPTYVKASAYIDFKVENNDKDPKSCLWLKMLKTLYHGHM